MKKCGFIGKLFGMCHRSPRRSVGRLTEKMWTKANALRFFKSSSSPSFRHFDKTRQRTEWNDYVDRLQKQGYITEHQAFTWSNPFDR